MNTLEKVSWVLLFNAILGLILLFQAATFSGVTDGVMVLTAIYVLYQRKSHYKLRQIKVSSVLLIASSLFSWLNIFIFERIYSQSSSLGLGLFSSPQALQSLSVSMITAIIRIVGIVFAFIEYHKVTKLEND